MSYLHCVYLTKHQADALLKFIQSWLCLIRDLHHSHPEGSYGGNSLSDCFHSKTVSEEGWSPGILGLFSSPRFVYHLQKQLQEYAPTPTDPARGAYGEGGPKVPIRRMAGTYSSDGTVGTDTRMSPSHPNIFESMNVCYEAFFSCETDTLSTVFSIPKVVSHPRHHKYVWTLNGNVKPIPSRGSTVTTTPRVPEVPPVPSLNQEIEDFQWILYLHLIDPLDTYNIETSEETDPATLKRIGAYGEGGPKVPTLHTITVDWLIENNFLSFR